MYALKKGEAGRTTFFPLTSMKPSQQPSELSRAESSKGFMGLAADLVDYDPKFSGVISSLLGRTLIFDHLDNATAFAKSVGFRTRIVTLDGQQINANG
jgi:chromosome segregation protein